MNGSSPFHTMKPITTQKFVPPLNKLQRKPIDFSIKMQWNAVHMTPRLGCLGRLIGSNSSFLYTRMQPTFRRLLLCAPGSCISTHMEFHHCPFQQWQFEPHVTFFNIAVGLLDERVLCASSGVWQPPSVYYYHKFWPNSTTELCTNPKCLSSSVGLHSIALSDTRKNMQVSYVLEKKIYLIA